MSSGSNQSVSDVAKCGDSDLKTALEAAFGPGAFELIAEPESLGEVDGQEGAQRRSPDPACGPSGRPFDTAAGNEVARGGPGDPTPAHPFVLFALAEDYFALPVSNVVEVQRRPVVTRIPRVPDWIRGIVNLRSSIVSVLDLRRRLGMASEESHAGGCMIVARSAIRNVTVGILVDRVVGMVSLSGLETTDGSCPLDEAAARYVFRLMKYDGRRVAVLNLEETIALEQPSKLCSDDSTKEFEV